MNYINSRKRINFSFLTLIVVLIGFLSMSLGVINSFANSNNSQSNPTATFIVNNNGDTSDLNTADGLCLDANGNCTLRAAIEQANALSTDDVITFASGITLITLPDNEIAINNNGTLAINGNGANVFTIRGGLDPIHNFGIKNRIFYVNDATVTITDATLTGGGGGGTGAGLTGRGGAILANGGNLTLDRIHVTRNESSSSFGGGGVYFLGFGIHRIQNSTFSGNYSPSRCGGFNNDGGTVEVTNSTISGNIGGFAGGGLCNLAGSTTLHNVTITENGANSGGGVFHNTGTVNFSNTIIGGNSASDNAPEIRSGAGGTVTSLGNNLIGDSAGDSANTGTVIAYQSTDIRDINPMLGALQNNGGTTPTHELLAESTAINAGNNANAVEATDQRGFTRIVGGIVDIGAFENQTMICTNTINPISQQFSASGGNTTVNVTNPTGCTYTAASNASWISVTSGGSGNGNGTVSLAVQPNTGSARTGTVTIAGQTFTVTQASGCTFTLSPTGTTVTGFAQTGSFDVISSSADCSYSAVSNDSFIVIYSGANGTGNGTVSFTVANNSGAARTGTITVGGQTFTISQTVIPSLTINNVSKNEGDSGTTEFDFTINLSAASIQTVSVIYATANGTATSPSDYQLSSNSVSFAPGETSKIITILVNGDLEIEPDETFKVNLSNVMNATIANGTGTGTIINDDFCSYSISPANLSVDAAGGNNTLTVTTQAGCAYTAASSDYFISITAGANGNGNGTISFTVAANSGAARTGSIFIAGQVINITQSAASVVARKTKFDFDGDGKADISVYRPDGGVWYLLQSQNGFTGAQFGVAADKIVPADYDGDGRTDLAVYRDGIWYLQRSTAGFTGISFGAPDDIPQPADFDGDGKAELAVYRPSNGVWYVFNLATNQFTFAQFGAATDLPVVGDYDGDGKANFAVFRPSNGFWYIAKASGTPSQNFDSIQLGVSTDKPVPADYDGDGKTDVAVFRPSNGTWYLLGSTQGFTGVQFGLPIDLPVPADYDGDGKADIAVYRSGVWYLQQTTAGFTGVQFGEATDTPVPNAFVP